MEEVSTGQKFFAAAAHGAYLVGGAGLLIVPLIIWLVSRGKSAFVAHHAKQAFFIQVFAMFIMVFCICLGAFAFDPMTAVVLIFVLTIPLWMIFSIVGVVKAMSGEYFAYPVLALCGMKKPGEV